MKGQFEHPYLVVPDAPFRIADCASQPLPDALDNKALKKKLKDRVAELDDLQRILYANDYHSVLLIFQAMDAAGKDSTIRAVLRGVDPAGCQVHSFKQPSALELEHDFLWRTAKRLPERGRIGVFNRSYYEEVLVVRVHPEYLKPQFIAPFDSLDTLWQERLESIADHEKHLANNGTLILKFWLNVSRDEQKNRFLSRLDEPEKHWKFSASDIQERQCWDEYMYAYQCALEATSKPWAPWFAIPADNKPYMRFTVADIIVQNLKRLKLRYPTVSKKDKARFDEYRKALHADK